MATLEKYRSIVKPLRVFRYFSDEFKKKKVKELEENRVTVSQLKREYSVSTTSIYRWIYKYSAMKKKGLKQVVEAKSDTAKINLLKDQVKEMERTVGQKQMMIDFLEKMIELAGQEYGVDLKKKFSSLQSNGSGVTGKRIRSK